MLGIRIITIGIVIIQLDDHVSHNIQSRMTSGMGTTVTSPWLNFLTPVLTILNFDLQFGSGQATSASVDIQSFGEVTLCLAASNGRTEPSNKDVLRLYRGMNPANIVPTERVY